MKRSEMLEKISDIIHTCRGHIESYRQAEAILELIEECGMKPPIEKKCPILLRTEHGWEPENAKSR